MNAAAFSTTALSSSINTIFMSELLRACLGLPPFSGRHCAEPSASLRSTPVIDESVGSEPVAPLFGSSRASPIGPARHAMFKEGKDTTAVETQRRY